MKKLALILFGISKLDHPHCTGHISKIDYRKSYANYKTTIFAFFEKQGYSVDVFLATNEMSVSDKRELFAMYNPKGCLFLPNVHSRAIQCRNARLNAAVFSCLQSREQYDTVLITRFDLEFQHDFEKCDIDLTKFNLVSALEHPHLVCDNFYLFPFHMLPRFADLAKQLYKVSFHDILPLLKETYGEEQIHFIMNEGVYISQLSFYKIVRDWGDRWN